MRFPSPLSALLLASLALVSFGTAACSFKLGDDTDGEKGTMTFAYQGLDGCFFGCGLDRSALQGSQVSVTASGGDVDTPQTARIAEASIARVSDQHQNCSCDTSGGNSSSSTSIDPAEKCPSGATKSCSLSIDIETSAAGDARLEVVDPKGAVIDSVVVHVRPAARIDVTVNGVADSNGQLTTVRVGDKVKLESHAFDANGDEAIFSKHGIAHDYGDKTIVGPDPAVIIGSTDVEDMLAIAPGDTTVKVSAPGAEQVVRFHVVAR